MFKKNNTNNTGMKLVIDAATAELLKETPGSDRYDKIVAQLERLNKIDANNNSREKINPNGLIAVAGNLAGIGIIVGHERLAVITSKAIGFVGKFR
jgi:hypothetical protein